LADRKRRDRKRVPSAAVFTNPRRLILLMETPPWNNLLRFLLHDFLDAGSEIFQYYSRGVSPWSTGHDPPDASSRRSDRGRESASDAAPNQALDASRQIAPVLIRPRDNCRASCAGSSVPNRGGFRSSRQNLVVGQIWREAPQVI